MGKLLRFGPTLLWLFTSLPLQAQAQTAINSLYLDPAWLTLIHYQPNTFGSGFSSQADDPTFFISGQGKTSPKAELNATLEAIQQPGEGNHHARCRFPARDAWLREQLNLPKSPINCPDYESWTDTLNTESITLVFAASYLNSPSSMFGHTFLRLDPPKKDEQTSLLLANTISYAADAPDQDNELLFIYQGVFGGYPGTTTVQPYYEKIRLYSDIEHRDLWEYKLNLNQQEVDTMLAHAWEIRDRNFDYFFFDENCAYRLLALIDVARPDTQLLDQVTTHAIPSDTVRWAVDKDLVADVHYRPSAATSVAYSLSNLPKAHQTLAAAIANRDIAPNSEKVQSLAPKEKANLLDATYDYVRYRSEADDWPIDIAAPLSHTLLRERSEIDGVAPPQLPPEPNVRDDQGHDTFRMSASAGQLAHREFTQLTFRPAYHDMLDPPAGYRSGAQLQFFRLDARIYSDNDELQLEQLTGLEIRSLSPRNAFFSPLSWQVGFGGRRTDTGNKRVLAPYVEGGIGGSWYLGRQTQAFAIASADLEIDNDLRRGYDAAPGADIGLLHQNDYFSFSGGVKTKAWIVNSQHRQDQFYAKANWHIGREFSLFAEFTREDHYDRYQSTWQAGLHAYF